MLKVNLKSLGTPSEENEIVTPEVGDEVEMLVKGVVKSVDGETANVEPTEVNDQPIGTAEMSDDAEEDEVEAMLREAEEEDRQSAQQYL